MAIYRACNGDVMGKEIVRFGKKQKQEYRKMKAEEEERQATSDSAIVRREARLYEERVAKERRRLGLC